VEAFVVAGVAREVVLTRKAILHLYVRLKPDGKLWISAPLAMSEGAIRRFLETKKARLESMVRSKPVKTSVPKGHASWFGMTMPLRTAPGNRSFLDRDAIWLADGKDPAGELEVLYKRAVVDVATRLWRTWETVLPQGVFAGWRFASSFTRTVYGSCSKKTKTIRLSSLLGRFEERHLETILVHELAHLLANGHGKDFYRVLLHWMPDYKKRHRELVEAHRNLEV
jgi:predicted metal-dependent hydrolase